MTPLLEALVDHIGTLPIEAADLQASGTLISDAVACMLGAQKMADADPALNWAREQPVSAHTTAMVLAAMSSVLEMDAMHVGSSVHPGIVVVPAALAAAIAVNASGPTLARAVLRGVEAAVRIGRATGPAHRGRFQSTSTCGGMGAALACADLFGLTKGQACDAMAVTGSAAGGLWAFLDEDTNTKQWHCGTAAANAVVAAQLASKGFRGPRRVLESERGFLAVLCGGGDAHALTAPSKGWQIHETAFKAWPSPRPTHAAITAALSARSKVAGRAVEQVILRTFKLAMDLCNRRPIATAHDARFSLQYCTACALADGAVDFDSFGVDALTRNLPFAVSVEVQEDPTMTAAYPDRSGASLEITLQDGTKVHERVEHALGDPERPLSLHELHMKHVGLLSLAAINPETELPGIWNIASSPPGIEKILERGFVASGLRFKQSPRP
jgi:2-methylcitrate dehydratase PrpD